MKNHHGVYHTSGTIYYTTITHPKRKKITIFNIFYRNLIAVRVFMFVEDGFQMRTVGAVTQNGYKFLSKNYPTLNNGNAGNCDIITVTLYPGQSYVYDEFSEEEVQNHGACPTVADPTQNPTRSPTRGPTTHPSVSPSKYPSKTPTKTPPNNCFSENF